MIAVSAMILIAFMIGIFVGAALKAHITINHVHKHVMDKPAPEPKKEEGYNASYGDPATMQYLDNQYRVGDE